VYLSSTNSKKVKNGKIMVQVDQGKKGNPISKTTRTKRAGGVSLVVEYLPSKKKALDSNPNSIKGKKKEVGRHCSQ
jgi:hypothetical protein